MKLKTKNRFKSIILTFLFSVLLSQIFSAWYDWTIVDPILNRFGSYDVSIEPINWPQYHDGGFWIRTNVINEGLKTVDNINVEYILDCEMDDYQKAQLHTKSLRKGEQDYFEFRAVDLDPDCSIMTDPVNTQMYEDKTTNKCYIKTSKESITEVCMWCNLNITVYDGYELLGHLKYPYPFSLGNVSVELTDTPCLNYSLAPNPDNLIRKASFNLRVYDFCPACIRGDITNKTWCEEHCPNK